MILSQRLQAVMELIIKNRPLADIGADHALLPIYLVQNKIIPCAIVGELGDGPFKRAFKAVQEANLENQIKVRQGDGLQVLEPDEVDTVVLAGLGGDLIVDILSYHREKMQQFARFVFQPMSRMGVLRRFLAEQGLVIIEEKLVQEKGRFFNIFSTQPGNEPYKIDDLEAELGSYVLAADTDLKRDFLRYTYNRYIKIYNSLNKAHDTEPNLKNLYKNRLKRLEAMLYDHKIQQNN